MLLTGLVAKFCGFVVLTDRVDPQDWVEAEAVDVVSLLGTILWQFCG